MRSAGFGSFPKGDELKTAPFSMTKIRVSENFREFWQWSAVITGAFIISVLVADFILIENPLWLFWAKVLVIVIAFGTIIVDSWFLWRT